MRKSLVFGLLFIAAASAVGGKTLLSRLVKRSLIQLVLFVLASSLAQAGSFTITFIDTSANHLDATGSFNYDTQSGFSAFIVQWNGVTFDMTGPANNPSVSGNGIACLLTANPQLSFGVLNHSVPDCPLFANPIWQGTSNSTTIEFRIASFCGDGDCGSVFFSGSLINQSNNPATSSQGTFDSPYCTDGDCGSLCADGDCGSVFLSGSLINQSNNPAHRFPGKLWFPNRRYDTRAGDLQGRGVTLYAYTSDIFLRMHQEPIPGACGRRYSSKSVHLREWDTVTSPDFSRSPRIRSAARASPPRPSPTAQ